AEQVMDRIRNAPGASRARHRQWPVAIAASVLATIGFLSSGAAQNFADVQRELAEMRRHYDAELKRLQRDYDGRIRRLEAQLKSAQSKPAAAPPVAVQPVAATTPITPPTPPAVAVSEAASMPAASPAFTIGTPPREPWPIGPVTPPLANAAASAGSFNPAI